jgi:hypothetical protein
MTITSDPGRWTFTASGASGTFNVPKPVYDAAALALYAVNQSTSAIYTPPYTVALAADRSGATISVSSGMTSGDKVVAYRVPYRTQAQPLTPSGPWPAKVIERQLDRHTADLSALFEMVRRAARFPLADDTVAAELPVAALRANKPLGFDGTGALSVLAGLPSVPISVPWEPVVTAASLGAGLTAAGFSDFMQTLIGSASEEALLAAAGLIAPFRPTGRLTLASGVPVMGSTAYTAKTVVYWTPYAGLARAPIWNGTRFVPIALSEISNDITVAAANVGPAAAQPYSCYDFFLTATGHLVRGPRWRKAQTFTVTLASPGVFTTGAAHGFDNGTPIYLETTGALPTGLAAATVYFVNVVSSTTFRVATSLANQVAGTYVNTSGSQSGTHTVVTHVLERGTGAGTAELETVQGIEVNKNAITNGPAARCGTYVGTGLTDASSQMNWHPGGLAAGGTAAVFGLWNRWNRVRCPFFFGDTTASWSYVTASWRAANGAANMRCNVVAGLDLDAMEATINGMVSYGAGSFATSIAIGANTTVGQSGPGSGAGNIGEVSAASGSYSGMLGMGARYIAAVELGSGTTSTFYGATSAGAPQTGVSGIWMA